MDGLKNIECFWDTLERCTEGELGAKSEKSKETAKIYRENFTAQSRRHGLGGKVIVEENTTFGAAEKYLVPGKTAVLDFANPIVAGGGVKNGANAQEEYLCRQSSLYPCISNSRLSEDFYDYHQKLGTVLYSDRLIYARGITVIKDDNLELLDDEKQFDVDVIVCAAPHSDSGAGISDTELGDIFHSRIKNIFEAAIDGGAEVLILGAFGCGSFGNPPKVIAGIFRRVIEENNYTDCFDKIVFAVKSSVSHGICPNLATFKDVFSDFKSEAEPHAAEPVQTIEQPTEQQAKFKPPVVVHEPKFWLPQEEPEPPVAEEPKAVEPQAEAEPEIVELPVAEEPKAIEPQVEAEPEIAEPPMAEEPEAVEPQTEAEPEIAEPPMAEEPEAVEPQVEVEPEIAEPPVAEEPEAVEPQAEAESEIAEPPMAEEPEVVEPQVEAEPEIAEPPVAEEPEAVETQAEAEPEIAEPPVAEEPEAVEPQTEAEPEIAEPPVAEGPEAVEPQVEVEPEIAEPPMAEEPEAVEPQVEVEPEIAEPPMAEEPEAVEPQVEDEPEIVGKMPRSYDFVGKRFSVFGDSISTLAGYIPNGYNDFYEGAVASLSGVKTPADTWWGQVIDYFGGSLLVNNSWSGCKVTKLPENNGLFPSACSNERTGGLHRGESKPDVIMIYLGFNDWAFGASLTPQRNENGFCGFDFAYENMLRKVKNNYPDAEVWCLTLCGTKMTGNSGFSFPFIYAGKHINLFNNVIRNKAKKFDCTVVDIAAENVLYDSIDGTHPNAAGMKTLSSLVIKNVEKIYGEKAEENTSPEKAEDIYSESERKVGEHKETERKRSGLGFNEMCARLTEQKTFEGLFTLDKKNVQTPWRAAFDARDPQGRQCSLNIYNKKFYNSLLNVHPENPSHPAPQRYKTVKDADEYFAVAYEKIIGTSVASMIKTRGAASEDYAVWLGMRVADALAFLHSREPKSFFGVIPTGNIVVMPNGAVRLVLEGCLDLIMSKKLNPNAAPNAYIPPDIQVGTGDFSEKSDVYCSGAMLYSLVTGIDLGAPPYPVIMPVRKVNPRLSPEFEQIILGCTAPKPENSIQSCAELLRQLNALAQLNARRGGQRPR